MTRNMLIGMGANIAAASIAGLVFGAQGVAVFACAGLMLLAYKLILDDD